MNKRTTTKHQSDPAKVEPIELRFSYYKTETIIIHDTMFVEAIAQPELFAMKLSDIEAHIRTTLTVSNERTQNASDVKLTVTEEGDPTTAGKLRILHVVGTVAIHISGNNHLVIKRNN